MLTLIYLLGGFIGCISLLVLSLRYFFDYKAKTVSEKYAGTAEGKSVFLKKYPEVNPEIYRPLFFRTGMALAIGFMIAAFSIPTYYQKKEVFGNEPVPDVFEGEIHITHTKEKEIKPEPKKTPPKNAEHKIIKPTDKEELDEETKETVDDVKPEDEIYFGNEVKLPDEETFDPNATFVVVEAMPEFPGGDEALRRYLSKTPYHRIARENGIEGIVYIRFVIDKDGTITNVELARSAYKLLDDAALNQVKKMPRWTPGKQREIPVKVQMVVPIRFSTM